MATPDQEAMGRLLRDRVAAVAELAAMGPERALRELERRSEPVWLRVLRVVDAPQGQADRAHGMSGRQAARLAQVAPHTAIACLWLLLDIGAVTKQRHGRADLWKVTPAAHRFVWQRR